MRVIIIHGVDASPDSNWFPWLSNELKVQGVECIVPALPSKELHNYESWKLAFEEKIINISSDDILIAHSIGPAFLLRMLEELKSKVKACFLVAGFVQPIGNEYFDKLNASFLQHDFDWEKIKSKSDYFKVYCSDNDPYVPLDRTQYLAKALGVELIVIPGARHINAEAGFLSFDRILLDLIKFL